MELTRILSPDYAVRVARNSLDAIRIAEEFSPDVILLGTTMQSDLHDQPSDKSETLALLKNSVKAGQIPVILVSGSSDPIDEEQYRNMGAADFIKKTFTAAAVCARVGNQIQLLDLKKPA